MEGTVKRLLRDKNFGFIATTESSLEYFFHRDDMVEREHFDRLREGNKVSFENDDKNRKGPRAGWVRIKES